MLRLLKLQLLLCLAVLVYPQSQDNYYTPYQKVLETSGNIEERLDAQAQLIFYSAPLSSQFRRTEELIKKQKLNQNARENQIQEIIYLWYNNNADSARLLVNKKYSWQFENDTIFDAIASMVNAQELQDTIVVKLRLALDDISKYKRDRYGVYKYYFSNCLNMRLLNNGNLNELTMQLDLSILLGLRDNINPNLRIKRGLVLRGYLNNSGNFHSSIQVLKSIESDVEKYGTKKNRSDFYRLIGYAYMQTCEDNLAKLYLLKEIKENDERNEYYGSVLINLSIIYTNENKKDSALYYLQNAERIFLSKQDSGKLSNTYTGLAEYYADCGNDSLFFKYVDKAKQLVDPSSVRMIGIYKTLAKYWEHNSAVSLSYLNKAIDLSEKNNTVVMASTVRTLEMKYNLLGLLGKDKEAAICLQKLTTISNELNLSKVESEWVLGNLTESQAHIEAEKSRRETQEKRDGGEKQLIIVIGILFSLTIGLGQYLIRLYSKNKRYIKSLKAYKKEGELLAHKTESLLNSNAEFIKQEVSKELHDNILSAVSGLRLMFEAILVKNNNTKKVNKESLEKIHKAVQASYKDVESYIDHLRFGSKLSNSIQHLEDLEPYIKNVLEPLDINSVVTFSSGDTAENLSDEKAFEIIRISKELINNIIKHAEANMVTFRVEISSDQLVLTCVDNGKGFDTSKQSTRGLQNIKDRVAKLQGQIDIVSNRGMGTLVSIHCPI